jgi:hypothetical protein
MGFTDLESWPALKPPPKAVRVGRPRVIAELESEIRQLYGQMLHEPVPPRLLGILRAGLARKI